MTDDAIKEILKTQFQNSRNMAMSDEMFLTALVVAQQIVANRLVGNKS